MRDDVATEGPLPQPPSRDVIRNAIRVYSGVDPMTDLLVEPFGRPFMARALVEVLLLGALGAAVGVFVMLRRLAFLTDALTHTVFPGVVIGFLVAGQSGIVPGALVFAVAAAALFTVLATTRRVGDDAAVALVLTSFFAAGVVLVSRQSSYTSDLTAFLFGRVLTVSSADIAWTAVVAAGAGAVLLGLRKELLLRAFDPDGAAAVGYRVGLLDLTLNLVIALVVVASVRAVGTVLVIALIVVPAAAARLLSDRLTVVVPLAVGLGMAAGWVGLVASYEASVGHDVRLAAGATIVLTLVAFYFAALVGGPALRWLRRHARPTTGPPDRPPLRLRIQRANRPRLPAGSATRGRPDDAAEVPGGAPNQRWLRQ